MNRFLAVLLAAVLVMSGCDLGGSQGRMLSETDLPLDFSFESGGGGMFGGCDNARRIPERLGTQQAASFESNEGEGSYQHIRLTEADPEAVIDALVQYVEAECPDEYQSVDGPDLGDEAHWFFTTGEFRWPVLLMRDNDEVHYFIRTGGGGGESYLQDLAEVAPKVLP